MTNQFIYRTGIASLFSSVARQDPQVAEDQWQKIHDTAQDADEQDMCTCCDPIHPGDDENCPVHGQGR